jgi:hypothetical protein
MHRRRFRYSGVRSSDDWAAIITRALPVPDAHERACAQLPCQYAAHAVPRHRACRTAEPIACACRALPLISHPAQARATDHARQRQRTGPLAAQRTAAHSVPARSAQRAQRTGHAATGGDGRCADPEAVPHSSATHKKGLAPLFPTTNTGSLTSISTPYPGPQSRHVVWRWVVHG